MVNFDLTINLGTILEIGVLLVGGVTTLTTLRNTVKTIKDDQKSFKAETKGQFDGIQAELKKLGDVLIGMARFDERITNLDKRVTAHGRQIDDMRRGRGFIRGAEDERQTVDGEY
ncbi:hypothetical protein MA20_31780 [Bradyrhizobium japonicum]|uniref:Uncharacterized protein n=2 Tax=Bradyrhizobium japonicum TaxID=375 RepID=A0A0A3XN14_BRAJP|nr:hypothetical protein MA20_31780 [Bradyrhizobium japonicum]